MTKQRQVFDRDTVAHYWANRVQDSARDAGGSLYFTGPTIYSYGSHFAIAHILSEDCGAALAGRVLWNDAAYSNTTAKHKSHVRRALSRQQWETALHMPSILGMGNNINPHHIDRDLREKKLPSIAPMVVNVVVSSVAALTGKRYGSGPFEQCLSDARAAETLALAFYARAGRKYPLPLVDSRPTSSDKAEWAAWVLQVSAVKLKADYAAELKCARDYAAQAETNAAECTSGFPYATHVPGQQWEARNIVSATYDVAQRAQMSLTKANALSKAITGKGLPRALAKLSTRMDEIAATFKARRQEFEHAETRNRVIYDVRQAIENVRNIANRKPYRRVWADMENLHSRAIDCGLTDSLYLSLAARYSRIGAAQSSLVSLDAAQTDLDGAISYFPGGHFGDAARMAADALRKCEFVGRLVAPLGTMAAHVESRIAEIRRQAQEIATTCREKVIAKHAETLRAWLAGESNVRPSYEAGTYARFNASRTAVETSQGASVPIEHACRLSRLYAITVRRGGQQWADGSGPMVGHYRVNHIGADGSLTIGCHAFDAIEAKRLHSLLSTCAECVGVSE